LRSMSRHLHLPMWTTLRGHVGLFYPLFCSFVALASCVVVDGWQTSPLLAIWAAGAGMRWYSGDGQAATDCVFFGSLNAYLARKEFKSIAWRDWEELDKSVAVGSWFLFSRIAIPLVLIGLFYRWQTYRKEATSKQLPEGVSEWTMQHPKARIFPCQTKHARMFPKRHAFEYSYLQCGFPIIPAGVMTNGTEVGLGADCVLGNWWLRIKAEDYLERGHGACGFYGKLKMYLQNQV